MGEDVGIFVGRQDFLVETKLRTGTTASEPEVQNLKENVFIVKRMVTARETALRKKQMKGETQSNLKKEVRVVDLPFMPGKGVRKRIAIKDGSLTQVQVSTSVERERVLIQIRTRQ